jgi:hypothetical protein
MYDDYDDFLATWGTDATWMETGKQARGYLLAIGGSV